MKAVIALCLSLSLFACYTGPNSATETPVSCVLNSATPNQLTVLDALCDNVVAVSCNDVSDLVSAIFDTASRGDQWQLSTDTGRVVLSTDLSALFSGCVTP